jgi:uncharacterized protein YjbI with pentapeptide repeats
LIGAALLAALLATLALAPEEARASLLAATVALANWLGQGMWLWPLAAALTATAAISPPARRRWPRPVKRIPPAIGGFAGLITLTTLAASGRPEVALLAVGVVVSVGLLTAWVLLLPRRLAPPVPAEVLARLNDHDRLEATTAQVKLQNDLRTSALQAIAGLAVLAGAVLGFQQLTEDRHQATASRELTLQGQASERFTRAIDQLGSERLEVRLGGIYGLEQIAREAPANRPAVTEVLVAYLHRRSPRPAKTPPDDGSIKVLRIRVPDAQAALIVLGRRQRKAGDPELDLVSLDLRAADLTAADLGAADLGAADLRAADLTSANLRDVRLRSANLTSANLTSASLGGVDLSYADLTSTDLGGANLTSANLVYADLTSASLGDADLSGAILRSADLRGARLRGARLRGADLRGAFLRGSDLRGVELTSMDLRGADLAGAFADQHTTWPDGFDPRGAGVQIRVG